MPSIERWRTVHRVDIRHKITNYIRDTDDAIASSAAPNALFHVPIGVVAVDLCSSNRHAKPNRNVTLTLSEPMNSPLRGSRYAMRNAMVMQACYAIPRRGGTMAGEKRRRMERNEEPWLQLRSPRLLVKWAAGVEYFEARASRPAVSRNDGI